jgi:hypothetical protein
VALLYFQIAAYDSLDGFRNKGTGTFTLGFEPVNDLCPFNVAASTGSNNSFSLTGSASSGLSFALTPVYFEVYFGYAVPVGSTMLAIQIASYTGKGNLHIDVSAACVSLEPFTGATGTLVFDATAYATTSISIKISSDDSNANHTGYGTFYIGPRKSLELSLHASIYPSIYSFLKSII